jgi:hypothetical protein
MSTTYFSRVAPAALLALSMTLGQTTAQASIVPVTAASDLSGATAFRTTPDAGGLHGNGAWAVAPFLRVEWDIAFNVGTSMWDYAYDVVRTGPGDVSHWILELTHYLPDGTDLTSYWNTIFTDDGLEVGTFGMGGSNPGIPGDIYGVKLNTDEFGGTALSFSTDHAPVWGDFYAKDGTAGGLGDNYAYNVGFTPDTGSGVTSDQGGPASATGPFLNWIPRPDGVVIIRDPVDPVPEATTIAMWLGLAGVFGVGLRARLRAA